jgi:ribosome maturation factor RimP
MSPPKVADRLWEIAEPLATHEGFEIVDVECRTEGRGMILRLFVDRPGGVTVDDLSRLSRRLGDVLDVHGGLELPYTLEVSSPGVNRRLARPEHYARYVGERIRVRTQVPREGRRNFLGTLLACTPSDFALRLPDGMEVRIAYADVQRANYEHDFGGATLRRPSGGSAAAAARRGRRT